MEAYILFMITHILNFVSFIELSVYGIPYFKLKSEDLLMYRETK